VGGHQESAPQDAQAQRHELGAQQYMKSEPAPRVALILVLGLMRKMMRLYPTLLAIALTFGTPLLCIVATRFFGELCWPQRVGAVYVGAAVFTQGFLGTDPARLIRAMSDGNTLRTHLNQVSYTVAIFGTLFAAFGDLLPASFYYGVPMCPA
jgi:hypothetical protein